MSFYTDRILPAVIHLSMSSRQLVAYRRRSVSAARGRVLEIGIGSGLNLPFYGDGISRLCGIDPSAALLDRASRQRGTRAFLARASAQALPFPDGSFDCVVTTWTLCSIPDVKRALTEMRRVLRRDGRLLFVEHGLAPDRRIERWQHRLTPCWRCLGGGCHLDRKIDALIAAAGFRIDELDCGYLRGASPFTYLYQGAARPDH